MYIFTQTIAGYCDSNTFNTLQESATISSWPGKPEHRFIGRHNLVVWSCVPATLKRSQICALVPMLQPTSVAVDQRASAGESVASERAFLQFVEVMMTVFLETLPFKLNMCVSGSDPERGG